MTEGELLQAEVDAEAERPPFVPPIQIAAELAEYSEQAVALAELRHRYAGVVFDLRTTKGDKEARQARQQLVSLRVALDKRRLELNAADRERIKTRDAKARELIAKVEEVETPIDEQIRRDEERREQERKAKVEAEERLARSKAEVLEAIRGYVVRASHKGSVVIESLIEQLVAFEPERVAIVDGAEALRERVLEQLRAMLAEAQAAEEERRRARAEAEAEQQRLTAEREAFEAEQREVRRRHEAELEAEAARRAEEQAERDRRDAELEERARRLAEAEAAAAAERERAELEAKMLREWDDAIAEDRRRDEEREAQRQAEIRRQAELEEEERQRAERAYLAAWDEALEVNRQDDERRARIERELAEEAEREAEEERQRHTLEQHRKAVSEATELVLDIALLVKPTATVWREVHARAKAIVPWLRLPE